MKIVFLSLNASYAHSSLAAPLLEAATRELGEWRLVQATVRDPVPEVAGRVIELEPDVVAATLYVFNRAEVLSVLGRVKTVLPGCRTIVGGPELLGGNEALLRANRQVDVAVRGEGELALAAWLRTIGEPAAWAEIPGVCLVDGEGTYRDGGDASSPEALDRLPSPVTSPLFRWDRAFVQLETSRGCASRCGFCVSSLSKGVKAFSPERVRMEFEAASSHGVKEVRLIDRTFNQPVSRCLGLLGLMREFPGLRFHVEVHPGQLPQSVREALRGMAAGQLHLDVGLQSTDVEVLRNCDRRGAVEAALEGLRFLCEAGNLGVHSDLIAGLPGATLATTLADVTRLIELGPEEVQLEVLKVLPGTPLREEAATWGLRFAPDPPYEVLQSATMTAGELRRAGALSRLLDRFYGAEPMREAVREAVGGEVGRLEALLAWMEAAGGLGAPLSMMHRLRLLDRYLAEAGSGARLILHRNWLLYGYATDDGPFRDEPWPEALPAGGTWPVGGPELLDRRHVRIRYLQQGSSRWWFLFDRSLHAQHAVGVYTIA